MVLPNAKTSRMRQRKLNLKQPLQVVREADLESFEANEPVLKEIQTGVEAHEEHEHHLQAVISAAQAAAAGGATAKASIPTRGTSEATLPYDSFYTLKFAQPATYIRFSSTVEDCIDGAAYDIIEEDDEFVRGLNEKLQAQAKQASARPTSRSAAAASESTPQNCTDNQFEVDMAAFEAAAKLAAPFSNSVNGDQAAPVLSLDEQLAQLPETLPEESVTNSHSKSHALLRALASHIYPHWQTRRSENGNNPLTPSVKVKVLETGDALDDNDPYVCFRRREVRAVRKTRGRDAQSSEKLRLLRRQLEDARQLLQTVLDREKTRKEVLTIDRTLFEQRSNLRGLKRSLPAQHQEDDLSLLINVKKPKKSVEPPPAQPPVRNPSVPGKVSGPDMQLLTDWYESKRRQQIQEVTNKVQQHKQWNSGFVDDTTTPIKPMPPDDGLVAGFRIARTEYLPTPPASSASGDSPPQFDGDDEARDRDNAPDVMRVDRPAPARGGMTASPPEDTLTTHKSSGRAASEHALIVQPNTDISAATPSEFPIAKKTRHQPVNVRYAPPNSLSGPSTSRSPSFRRRIGRGGRQWIDRRHMPRFSTPDDDEATSDNDGTTSLTPLLKDRFKFDHDSDDDADDDPDHVYKELVDPYDWRSMFIRAQNCLINNHASGSGQSAAIAAQAQMQKQRHMQQLQAQAQGYSSTSGQAATPNLQTVRQQVAAAQQHAAAQAAASANAK